MPESCLGLADRKFKDYLTTVIVFALLSVSGLTVTISPAFIPVRIAVLLTLTLVVVVTGKVCFSPARVCITIDLLVTEITVPATSLGRATTVVATGLGRAKSDALGAAPPVAVPP